MAEKRRLMSEPATEKKTTDLLGYATGVGAVEGVEPVWTRPYLKADIEELDILILDAEQDGDEPEAERLRTKRLETVKALRESRVIVRLRGLSPSKAKELVKEAEALGLDENDGWLFVLANQIVSPAWDYDKLKELQESVNPQLQRLVERSQELNLQAGRDVFTVPL